MWVFAEARLGALPNTELFDLLDNPMVMDGAVAHMLDNTGYSELNLPRGRDVTPAHISKLVTLATMRKALEDPRHKPLVRLTLLEDTNVVSWSRGDGARHDVETWARWGMTAGKHGSVISELVGNGSVIQGISHDEPSAVISEGEAAEAAECQRGSYVGQPDQPVERSADEGDSGGSGDDDDDDNGGDDHGGEGGGPYNSDVPPFSAVNGIVISSHEKIYLINMTGIRPELFDAFDKHPVLAALDRELQHHGHCVKLIGGCRVFTAVDIYRKVRSTLQDHLLCAQHTIASEAYLPFVHAAIKSLPCNYNVKVSSEDVIAYVNKTYGRSRIYPVDKTFITSPRNFRDARSVCQSTTEVRCRKRHYGMRNPRRIVDSWTTQSSSSDS